MNLKVFPSAQICHPAISLENPGRTLAPAGATNHQFEWNQIAQPREDLHVLLLDTDGCGNGEFLWGLRVTCMGHTAVSAEKKSCWSSDDLS